MAKFDSKRKYSEFELKMGFEIPTRYPLRVCPICRGHARMVWTVEEIDFGYHVECVGCKECPLYGSTPYRVHDTEFQAAILWNYRCTSPKKYRELAADSYRKPRSVLQLHWRDYMEKA